MKKGLEERIAEIKGFAQNNGNKISYKVAMDILKNKENYFTEEEILDAMGELSDRGVIITPDEDEEYPISDADPENFIPAEVNIGQRPVTVYHLMERLENHGIDLNPSFQRKGDLWTMKQQSRLIESLMLKIPIPAFYFNASEDDNWIVIDGLQRLTAFPNLRRCNCRKL